ncbi:heterokaryon incompatibility protein-domain-containing protein [Lophiotrema nucula]|uniref:Heterokaryon incompatibility protein-domain-containing protein n=1 Tax=Lophiotrema nucula TaxID=690887 RepID=A0A6A5Z6Q7_9PLEO|nr:heterokaryon incompatibility protein-domain-containing protein [Lophiotrema nucula]
MSDYQATDTGECSDMLDLCSECSRPEVLAYFSDIEVEKPSFETTVRRSSRSSRCRLCRFFATVATAKGLLVNDRTEVEYELGIGQQDVERFVEGDLELCCLTLGVARPGTIYIPWLIVPVGTLIGSDPVTCQFHQFHHDAIDYNVCRDWIRHCQDHHANCREPFRLEQTELIGHLRLIDCATRDIINASKESVYVALSYVWGDDTQSDSLPPIRGCLPEDTPTTINDAIDVVLRMRRRYLWVDKYCVDQTDEADKAIQLAMMDRVYSCADFTIIAAAGEGSSYGLPGVNKTQRRVTASVKIRGKTWIPFWRYQRYSILRTMWATRGWTYQEALFSRRRLFFTDEAIYFECNTWDQRETLQCDLRKMDSAAAAHLRLTGLYSEHIASTKVTDDPLVLGMYLRDYNSKQLSRQSDAINALRGVFRFLQDYMPTLQFFYGIPVWIPTGNENGNKVNQAFAIGLCWRNYGDQRLTRRHTFPSWSWAGWQGPVEYPGSGSTEDLEGIDVQIWLQKKKGELERLDATVLEKLAVHNPEAIGYTPELCIEATTVDFMLCSASLKDDGSQFVFFANHQGSWDPSPTTLEWVTFFEQQERMRDVVSGSLELKATGLLIGRMVLLLVSDGDYMERRGLMGRFGSMYRFGSSAEQVYGIFDIRDFFPTRRQKIFLR